LEEDLRVLIFAAFFTEKLLDDDDWSAKDWLIFLLVLNRVSRLAVTCKLAK